MSAHLFTGLVSRYSKGAYVDSCSTIILYGADEDAAAKTFQTMLLRPDNDEDSPATKIEIVVRAPVLDQLLTETGQQPIRWPEIARDALQILEASALDDETQGYWVDCEQVVRPGNSAAGIDWLKRELPEEIRSGLNWSGDKRYFFLISVLRPPRPQIEFVETAEEDQQSESGSLAEEAARADAESQQRLLTFPQLAEKELAVVVQARNSVVASWLWRKHAGETPWATKAIRVDPLCETLEIGKD